MRFADDFHSWLCHPWKSLANHLTHNKKSLFTITYASFYILSNKLCCWQNDFKTHKGTPGKYPWLRHRWTSWGITLIESAIIVMRWQQLRLFGRLYTWSSGCLSWLFLYAVEMVIIFVKFHRPYSVSTGFTQGPVTPPSLTMMWISWTGCAMWENLLTWHT